MEPHEHSATTKQVDEGYTIETCSCGATRRIVWGSISPPPPEEWSVPLEPGWYWVRFISNTNPELLKKYHMTPYFDRIKEWTGTVWHSDDAWHSMTMEQFKNCGHLLGPPVDKPRDDQFHQV